MQHRHLVAEGAAEPAHRLRREPDLGNQHDGAAPRGQHPAHRLEVDQRLAAAGDAEEQRALARVQRLDRGEGRLLIAGEASTAAATAGKPANGSRSRSACSMRTSPRRSSARSTAGVKPSWPVTCRTRALPPSCSSAS